MPAKLKEPAAAMAQLPTWVARSDCRVCKIFNEAIFSRLTDLDVDGIVNGIYEPIDEYQYEMGQLLYQEGHDDPAIFTIRKGLVKLVRYLPDGTERIIRLIKAGDSIGLERTLDKPYGHTAIAIREVHACRIPIGVMQQLDEEKPRFYRGLMERWAANLFQADDYITLLLSGTVRQRVIHLVKWLASSAFGEQARHVELLSGKDMSALLDISIESISRIVAELKREKILRQVDGRIYELDNEALARYARNDS